MLVSCYCDAAFEVASISFQLSHCSRRFVPVTLYCDTVADTAAQADVADATTGQTVRLPLGVTLP